MKEQNQSPGTQSCEIRIDHQLEGRLADLRRLWEADGQGQDGIDDLGTLADYGLSFDYVTPGTFTDQPEGYFRYQLSWGGPSDEFRFFVNPDLSCHRIEYWFLDWFDGAGRTLADENRRFLLDLWDWFREVGAAETAMQEARR